MAKASKILTQAKSNAKGVAFSDLQKLVEAAGFTLARTKGSHRVYNRDGVAEIIDLQPIGHMAKPYQVRQVLDLIEKYEIKVD